MLAYLVIREGTKWTDVFRLVPGRTVTIGRAATNQIVVKDDRASRNHAEVFLTNGQWTVRDLDSRNGTPVGNRAGGGRPSAVAGRHHPHCAVSAGLRARSVQGVCRCQRPSLAAGKPERSRAPSSRDGPVGVADQ